MRTRVLPPLALVAALAVAGCSSTPPATINDVCAVFTERSGLLSNWYVDARRASDKYGIPVYVLMATMRVESGFDGDARPPRYKILGFIPWKRKSSAYGYAQALDGTWSEYREDTGQPFARRGDFGDSIDFIGWYHSRSVARNGVSPHDAYSLQLNYYAGWGGYANGSWRNNGSAKKSAARAASFAQDYRGQLAYCKL